MGGTGGTPTQMGGPSSVTSASNPNSFAGSRAALQATTPQPANNDFSDWLASIPNWAGGQSFINALASNPTVPVGPTPAAALAAPSFIPSAGNVAAGFQSALPGFEIDPNTGIQHLVAPAPAPEPVKAPEPEPVKAPEPEKPITETGTKIWPPGPQWDAVDFHAWLAANPHWADAVEVPDRGPPGTPGNSWYQKKGAPL